MEGIKIIIIIFGLLFLIESKPMNILFNFIGLIISVAILLGFFKIEYLSYLLIIIYCSALTIIFAFVIMLSPDSFSPLNYNINNNKKRYIPIIIIISYILFFYDYFFFHFDFLEIFDSIDSNSILINKIGNILYSDEINILKFMVATLILLLALIALFYILMPTI